MRQQSFWGIGLLLLATGCGEVRPPMGGMSLLRFPEDAFPIPTDNQPTPARRELGWLLFFDPVLSKNKQVACGSCHLPERAMGDGRRVGEALALPERGPLPRSTPTIFNVRYQHVQFWDGRAKSLEELALMPVENPLEMASSAEQAVLDVGAIAGYQERFQAAYGELTEATLRRAMANFLRSVTSNDTKVDRYLAGDPGALSDEAQAGFDLFFGKARCSRCHYLPLFAGTEGPSFVSTEFRVTGVPERGQALLTKDAGRAHVSGEEELTHAFKAPTLRNIAETGPYMHNGAFDTLREVIDFYDKGPLSRGYAVPHLDFVMARGPLGLTEAERHALEVFLREGLTDLSQSPVLPTYVPSGLLPGGRPAMLD